MEKYTELVFEADNEIQELLVAELSPLNFDSFTQEDNRLMAYSLSEDYAVNQSSIDEIVQRYGVKLLSFKEIENNVNWNKEWEESFQPIVIGNEIYVRAQFHETKQGFKHEIIIQPKMSFGTGHHETTQLMMELMLEHNFMDAACLDMGCGTGVLAILAEQLGAAHTIAVDYDSWCFENTQENFEINGMKHATAVLGDAQVLSDPEFLDLWMPFNKRVILSNITKNYNLENISIYHQIAQPGNIILISGFYEDDLQDLRNEAAIYGLIFVKSKVRNNWCAAVFLQQ
jgi:ribosomal protein L11 methyltransferase